MVLIFFDGIDVVGVVGKVSISFSRIFLVKIFFMDVRSRNKTKFPQAKIQFIKNSIKIVVSYKFFIYQCNKKAHKSVINGK